MKTDIKFSFFSFYEMKHCTLLIYTYTEVDWVDAPGAEEIIGPIKKERKGK